MQVGAPRREAIEYTVELGREVHNTRLKGSNKRKCRQVVSPVFIESWESISLSAREGQVVGKRATSNPRMPR